MPYFLCDIVGTGADAEGNQFRPALALHSDDWSAVCYGADRVLVRAPHRPAFDTDARIRPMRRALLAALAPDDGEVDNFDAPELARKIARRLLVQQWLGIDDFGGLNSTIGDIPAAKRQRIRNRLLAFRPNPIDISALTNSTTIADALRVILPQINLPLDPAPLGPSGTFTDDFTEAGDNIDLASHTPSGGGAWNRVDGSASMAIADKDFNVLLNNTSDSNGALYQCTDQASANQYVQATIRTTGHQCFTCNRASARTDFIGMRSNAAKVQMFKRVAGTFTQLGSTGATTTVIGDLIRLESSGNSHTAYLNGVSQVGPVTETHNNSVTRQGVNARSDGSAFAWLDNFEAGVLGAGGAIAATTTVTFTPTATLAGDGALVGASAVTFTPTAALTGAGALAGTSAATFTPTATLTGAGALAGVSALSFTTAGAVTGAGALAGVSAPAFTLSGTLQLPAGFMTGTSAVVFTPSATLTATGALAGASAAAFTTTAALTGAGALAGTAALSFAGTGSMLQAGDISGLASLSFTAQGVMLADGAMAGTSVLSMVATATISATGVPVIAKARVRPQRSLGGRPIQRSD